MIGTPPNLILLHYLSPLPGQPLNFSSWLGFALPSVATNLALAWLLLLLRFSPASLACLARPAPPLQQFQPDAVLKV